MSDSVRGHPRFGKPKAIVVSDDGEGSAPMVHLADTEVPPGSKRCAGCSAIVPEEARVCPECLHEFPPLRHSAEGLKVRGGMEAAVSAAGSRGETVGRHAVVATCPKCRSRVFVGCEACGRSDAFRMDSGCVHCLCGVDTNEVDCPRCGAVIDRRGFRVHFEGITGVSRDQDGTAD
jgi:hypothetical protein